MLEKFIHHDIYYLNPILKKQRANKIPIHLQDKVNRLLDILEQY